MRTLVAGNRPPRSPTACGSLPPEGARFALGRPGGETRPPWSPTARGSLPPEGAHFALGRPGGETRPPRLHTALGFTLLELMVVVAIMAMATAGVSLAMRDSSQSQLEREAARLAALLESARAQSRMTANPVLWRTTGSGFVFDGLPVSTTPSNWLGNDVVASTTGNGAVVLGPEPIIGPQRIRLASLSQPARSLTIATDGVHPFQVLADADAGSGTP